MSLATIALLVLTSIVIYYSPDDYLQGNLVKILYIHVPCAWLSLIFYAGVTLFSFLFLVSKNNLYDVYAKSLAFTSIYLTMSTLCIGSIWGKPAWGTWWVWDARLTSMAILLLSELIYFMIRNLFHNKLRSAKAAAIFAIISAINLPIIKFSVELWTTLHQKSSVFRMDGIKIDPAMLTPLILMFLAILFIAKMITFLYIKGEIMSRKKIALDST
jgi:heme exporter protein C